MKNIIYKSLLLLGAVALLLTSSCKKNDDVYGNSGAAKTDPVISKIKDLVGNLPHFKAVNSLAAPKKGGDDEMTVQGGWDFANPGNGYHYSAPNGVNYSSSSNTFTIASTGGGNAGGAVVAGASSLDMNYTFCFSINDQVNGLSSFANCASTNVAGVIGVAGDFSKLKGNAADFGDVFKGLAYYIVFSDGAPNGSYDVLDWMDSKTKNNLNNTSGNSPLHNKCFALVVDFKNGRFFLSTKGKIKVSGGTMDFNGEYYEVSGFKVNNSGTYDYTNATYKKVSGFGAMGCN